MVHVQGSLELAKRIKRLRPDIRIMLGGVSSTYYHEELIRYPYIDMVMRGYDTHSPTHDLLNYTLKDNSSRDYLALVPNLTWKEEGNVHINPQSYNPKTLENPMDMRRVPKSNSSGLLPINDVLTVENGGCVHNCGWCGGSANAFRRINGTHHSIAQKSMQAIATEMREIGESPEPYNYYSLGTYSEPRARLREILRQARDPKIKSLMYDQL